MSNQISRGAFDYAREAGIERAASEGGGLPFMNRIVAAKAAMLRPQLFQARIAANQDTTNRLGEGTLSGQHGTARAAVEAYGFGEFASSIAESEQANEGIRQQAQGQWMNVLMDYDSRQQQADEFERGLEASKGNWFDRALGIASLVVPTVGAFRGGKGKVA
jgi:hypothetical protein